MKNKHLLLIMLAGLTYTSAFAQTVIKTQKTIGGSNVDEFSSMYITKDSGLIAGGYSYSDRSGEKTEDSRGPQPYPSPDYWVVKLDRSGKISWDKTVGGSADDFLTAIQQTNDGGYILGGASPSNISGEKTENSRGSYDYWIVKLDWQGNIQWDKTMGGSKTDWLTTLQQTSDGGYIIGGFSSSGKSGEKTEKNRSNIEDYGDEDYWIIKLDNTGKIQWDKTMGGIGDERLMSLEQTSDGGYILGGWSDSYGSGEKTQDSRGGGDYWVVKLDASGNIQWDKTMGGGNWDYLTSVQQTTDGGYILGGYTSSNASGEKTESSRGLSDYWMVKLSASGNIQWDKTIGGSDWDNLTTLQQTSDGGYISGGNSSSNISGEKTENGRGANDYWVVKMDSTGKIQWDKTIGGDSDDYCYSIKELVKNFYVIGGYSNSSVSGDKTQKSRGSYDYWGVLLHHKTSKQFVASAVNKKSVASLNNGFSIYPNPVKDILHIRANGKAGFSLTDRSGIAILIKTINNNGEINVSQLPAGLYYLKNTTTGEVQKVIIAK